MRLTSKPVRFLWRLSRNLLCTSPVTRRLIFPPEKLSVNFGRGDVEYAWRVFLGHWHGLAASGYTGSRSILEAGPGRNLGTSLLWWAVESARAPEALVRVVLWDVFPNARIDNETWRVLAQGLLASRPEGQPPAEGLQHVLERISHGSLVPDISYVVCHADELAAEVGGKPFDLVYSHAALEHAWHIERTWRVLKSATAPGGWHSHRIDLADHGSRETNYIEMLEWSAAAYWLTMRFTPGAINRWRAFQHVDCLKGLGFHVIREDREVRADLPTSRSRLASPFCRMSEVELKTTALDLVARLP